MGKKPVTRLSSLTPKIVLSKKDNVFKGNFKNEYHRITKKLSPSSKYIVEDFEMNFTSKGEIQIVKYKLLDPLKKEAFKVMYRANYKIYTISKIEPTKEGNSYPESFKLVMYKNNNSFASYIFFK